MIKKLFLLSISFFSMILNAELASDFITYDWLTVQAVAAANADHIPHWRHLFNHAKVRGFIECGCGYSTRYFLDNADKVVSIEYVNPGYGDSWYQDCVSLYADVENWMPILYNKDFRSNSFNNACGYQCSEHRDYALIDAAYVKELYKHFKEVLKQAESNGYPIDAAFVHPNIYLRGDLVNLLLLHKVPIVAAHDTVSDHGTEEETNLYGWNKVATPEDYVKIYIPFGQGTTFWINKEQSALIASLQRYSDSIILLKDLNIDVGYEYLKVLADK